MLIREITDVIERFAPLAWQESYDNAGLIVGRPDDEVRKALLAVDVTDEVMAEAEREGCDLIITHHPIVFHALKRFNSADQVQRCVERAIRSGIALYACHTNLDSAPEGMVCTGAGASMIGEARRAGADIYITADMKYNDFMTPDKALTVADIGHFESEYCAIQILFDILSKNLITFAVRKSEDSRNPVNYLV